MMPHQYSAENHDWDLTLRAAWSLLMSGQAVNHLPTPGTPAEKEFSCYTGSMVLSFCAVESFSASIAFSMPKEQKFSNFDFDRYRRTFRFWDKVEQIFASIPYPVDRSQGLFQTINEMQEWRNLVAHSSPYEIETTTIQNTTDAPRRLHEPFYRKEYTRRVRLENAKQFYMTAINYIELLTSLTGINPRASATYVVGEPTET
jgi:hypothetical protein